MKIQILIALAFSLLLFNSCKDDMPEVSTCIQEVISTEQENSCANRIERYTFQE